MDIVLVLLVFALLPLVLVRPFAGAVVYTALAYLRPQNLVGGIAPEMRLSLIVLAATLAGLFLAILRGREKPLVRLPFFALLAALLLAMLFAVQSALFPGIALSTWGRFLQLLAGVSLTVALCDSPPRIRAILVTAALSVSAMALVSLVDPVWDRGRLTGGGGKFRDSNDFALLLAMAIPLLVFLRRGEGLRGWGWRRLALTLAIPCVLAAIVLTGSRGGFLALATVGIGWVLLSPGRPVRLALAPIVALFFFALAPSSYVERMTTIRAYAHDSSARDRLSSWNVALRIAEDRPLTGVGPGNFLPAYPRYATDGRSPHVAHNAFLQLLAESGLFAVMAFSALLAAAAASAWSASRRAHAWRSRLLAKGDRARAARIAWISQTGRGLVLSLLAFTVGAQFLSRDDFDLFYLLAGLAGAFAVVARREFLAEGFVQGTTLVAQP